MRYIVYGMKQMMKMMKKQCLTKCTAVTIFIVYLSDIFIKYYFYLSNFLEYF